MPMNDLTCMHVVLPRFTAQCSMAGEALTPHTFYLSKQQSGTVKVSPELPVLADPGYLVFLCINLSQVDFCPCGISVCQ